MRILVVRRKVFSRAVAFVCMALVLSAAVRVLIGDPAREQQAAAQQGGQAQSAVASPSGTRQIPVYSVDTKDKKIAISFDAAWGAEKTSEIMDILDQYDLTSTFFLVKFWVEAYPEKTQEIAERGHEIGNHSSTHPKMSQLSKEQILLEVNGCADVIEELTGMRPTLFRPPFGDYNDLLVNTLRENGYEAIQWSKDSLDWKSQGVQAMVNQVTKNISPGDIVLFHNNSDHILEALPIILEDLINNKGYTIVPISELLIDGDSYVDRAGVLRAGEAP